MNDSDMYTEFVYPEFSQSSRAWIEEELKPPSTDRVLWQSSPSSSAALNKLKRNVTVPSLDCTLYAAFILSYAV